MTPERAAAFNRAMEPRGYDPKCAELARYFLEDGESLAKLPELARHIQDSIEDWLGSETAVGAAVEAKG